MPKYPPITRDLAVVLPEAVPAGDVLAAVKKAGGELLVDSRLFDVYTGDRVDKGYRSLAISLLFRAADRTLTDEDADAPFRTIVSILGQEFGARLRS